MPATVEIEVEDLHKAFGDNPVLQGIDLRVFQGEILAIVGGSGCGKTVLLSHVLGKVRPDHGHVRVVDHGDPEAPLRALDELDAFEVDRLHQHWGVVFQRNALFSGSVYDNIALWLKEVRQLDDADIVPIARRSLDAVGLDSDDDFLRMDHLELSGGMAKRLAIARAIAMEPVVLFYDEPTTGLDPASSAQIHDLIHTTHHTRLAGQVARTTLIITHDKDLLVRLRPRIVMLHAGRVFFDGPFEAFEQSRSEVIRPYFEQMPVLTRRVGTA